MSVVVKTPEGKYIIYCKGADEVRHRRPLFCTRPS